MRLQDMASLERSASWSIFYTFAKGWSSRRWPVTCLAAIPDTFWPCPTWSINIFLHEILQQHIRYQLVAVAPPLCPQVPASDSQCPGKLHNSRDQVHWWQVGQQALDFTQLQLWYILAVPFSRWLRNASSQAGKCQAHPGDYVGSATISLLRVSAQARTECTASLSSY